MGGAEGGAGLAAGLVGGEELLDLDSSAAVKVGFGHHPTKSDLRDDVNHGGGRSLTFIRRQFVGGPVTRDGDAKREVRDAGWYLKNGELR